MGQIWKAVQALREAGLTVHEIEEGQTEDSSVKMLGWEIHGNGRVTPSHERLWRVRLAIRELLRRGKSSGQQLERLVGHMTFISLCRREALSVLGESYTFIRRHYQQIVPLWKSVRNELEKWDGIAPLIFSDLRRPWSERLLAVDASEWGLGVTTSQIKSADSQALGGCIERWRFRGEEAKNPRQLVITEDEQVLANDRFGEEPGSQSHHQTGAMSTVIQDSGFFSCGSQLAGRGSLSMAAQRVDASVRGPGLTACHSTSPAFT